jgi:hypothetical protein
LILIGAVVRALSTLPIDAYDKAVPRKTQFWITFCGQVLHFSDFRLNDKIIMHFV